MVKYTLEHRMKVFLPLAAVIGGTFGWGLTYGLFPKIVSSETLQEVRSLEATSQVQRYLRLTWATPGLRGDLLENSIITEPLHSGYVSGAFLGTLLGGWYILRSQRAYEENHKRKEKP